jgi:hypothetical protein
MAALPAPDAPRKTGALPAPDAPRKTKALPASRVSRKTKALPSPASPDKTKALEQTLPPLGKQEPGAYLRSCREHRGLSIPDLFEKTRIRSLADIEAERFEDLPPERYVASFVEQYARALGIAEFQPLVERYLERYRAALATRYDPHEQRVKRRRVSHL